MTSPRHRRVRRAKVVFATPDTAMFDELAQQGRGFGSEEVLAETLVAVKQLLLNDRRAPKPKRLKFGLLTGYYVIHATDTGCLLGIFRDSSGLRHFVYFHTMICETGTDCAPVPDVLEHADDRTRRLGL